MSLVRIGTWNLAGRWSDEHAALIHGAECDVWLLTEVNERTELPGHELHASAAPMAPHRQWAAIASNRLISAEPDPHPASARARIGSTTFVSSILPWKGCGKVPPWVGDRHAEWTHNAVAELRSNLADVRTLVWGGDWNHAMSGREYAGSKAGRLSITDALDDLGLHVPTALLPHPIDGVLSIDHVAVPHGLAATASRVVAEHEGRRLSDHDAYVVEVDL